MSNIDIYKEYIQDSIINHLERLMGNDVVDDVSVTSFAHAVTVVSIITSSSIAARRVAPSPEAKGAKKSFLILIVIVYF